MKRLGVAPTTRARPPKGISMTTQYDSTAPSSNAFLPPAHTGEAIYQIAKLAPLCARRMTDAENAAVAFKRICDAVACRPAAARGCRSPTSRPTVCTGQQERPTVDASSRAFVFRDETGDGSLFTFDSEAEARRYALDWERATGRVTRVLEVHAVMS